MLTRSEIKQKTKDMLSNIPVWTAFAPYLMYLLIEAVLSGLSAVVYVTALLAPLAQYLLIKWQLNFVYKNETSLNGFFNPIKDLDMDLKVVVTMLLSELFIGLAAILFIIPGIILYCAYALVPYILADLKDYGYTKALKLSKEMMRGHKWEYFILLLSFIGWIFLIALTFGILIIWKGQYISMTFTNYYLEIKKEYMEKNPGVFKENDKGFTHEPKDVEEVFDGKIEEETFSDEDIF